MSLRIRPPVLTLVALLVGACKYEPDPSVVGVSPPTTNAPPAPAAEPPAPREVAPAVPTIGKLAPEIVGQDIDGNPMKLSDYRCKVVMLDFWGNW